MSPYVLGIGLVALLLVSGGKRRSSIPPSKTVKTSAKTGKGSKTAKTLAPAIPVKSYPEFAGKRFLLIGDSLSVGPNSPGGYLGSRLLAGGAVSVEVNSKGGRSANSFWGSKKGSEKAGRGEDQLADALLRLRPGDIALVMLGTNDVSGVSTTPTMESGFLNNMKNIVKKLHDAGVTVIGIGPPAFPPEDQPHQFKKGKPPKVYATGDVVATSKTFVPKLKKVYTDLNEQFIDSRDITSDLATMAQRRDGIHFTDHDAADAWAARLAEAVSSCL